MNNEKNQKDRLYTVSAWGLRLLLVPVFYLIFVPVGFLLRLFGVDWMHRRPNPRLKTYWHTRPEPPQ